VNIKAVLTTLFLGLFCAITVGNDARAETLRIASIDWCPQLCQDQERRGYITEIVEMVFEGSRYNLDITVYPWTRAIFMVRSGRAHALLSPTKNEAPNLLYPERAIGAQKMCFFSAAESKWRYSGVESLMGLDVGIAQDTSTKELDAYMRDNGDSVQVIPYDHSYIEKSLKKILAGRVDTFLSTYNSVIDEIRTLKLVGKYRSAGCLAAENIYMAFSPDQSREVEVEKMMAYFDRRMRELKSSDRLQSIFDRYQLE